MFRGLYGRLEDVAALVGDDEEGRQGRGGDEDGQDEEKGFFGAVGEMKGHGRFLLRWG